MQSTDPLAPAGSFLKTQLPHSNRNFQWKLVISSGNYKNHNFHWKFPLEITIDNFQWKLPVEISTGNYKS
jgi:hypothetical protein